MNQPLSSKEQAAILQLAHAQSQVHLHLDWYSLDRWLRDPELIAAVRSQKDSAQAFLAAALQPTSSPDEPKAAWLRFVIPPPSDSHPRDIDNLWSNLRSKLLAAGLATLSLLEIDDWVAGYAQHWGFVQTNSVITFRSADPIPLTSPPNENVRIRDSKRADLPGICQVDWAAFDPIWRYDRNALLAASEQSSTCTVLEYKGKIAGYQMSTRYTDSGHLARLAISPSLQGQGLGALLLDQVIYHFRRRRISVVTVNTQQDNLYSQRLYGRYGFEFTGHTVPVWTLNL
jgi:ribosomal protein S18 acetylase RimI-like enzyme